MVLLLVAIYYTVNQMGHKQISYISNGRVHKSDEIAEEEKYLRGRIDLVKKKTSILII